MSNTSIVTKLLTLVKGAFGRKDTASDAVLEPRAEDGGQAAENGGGEQKTSTATAERAEEAAPAEQAGEEAAEPAKPESAGPESAGTEPEAPVEKAATPAPEAPAEQAEEKEPAQTPTPATEDVPEKAAAIAQELGTNEHHTEVASDDVLERVRKGAAPSADELAVPTYDELTLPSIRARLRKLTIDQVRDLRAYEVAHQARPEFIKMYDNRIAKLQAEER
ncbi:hypothetical protein [Nocardiopsis xinjiangensis]|uniref:hypothetical protein n=1 Tax=Nocardiopsis xinjiangensis TaxID=124285 RepID=UPI0003474559|nr:hypothetical protein [Nocardiopsis xinjiangensis]